MNNIIKDYLKLCGINIENDELKTGFIYKVDGNGNIHFSINSEFSEAFIEGFISKDSVTITESKQVYTDDNSDYYQDYNYYLSKMDSKLLLEVEKDNSITNSICIPIDSSIDLRSGYIIHNDDFKRSYTKKESSNIKRDTLVKEYNSVTLDDSLEFDSNNIDSLFLLVGARPNTEKVKKIFISDDNEYAIITREDNFFKETLKVEEEKFTYIFMKPVWGRNKTICSLHKRIVVVEKNELGVYVIKESKILENSTDNLTEITKFPDRQIMISNSDFRNIYAENSLKIS